MSIRYYKTKAQLSECVKQGFLDLCIKKHKEHKEVLDKGIVRIVPDSLYNTMCVYVKDILVYYSIKERDTKKHINDILDTVVAMMGDR